MKGGRIGLGGMDIVSLWRVTEITENNVSTCREGQEQPEKEKTQILHLTAYIAQLYQCFPPH